MFSRAMFTFRFGVWFHRSSSWAGLWQLSFHPYHEPCMQRSPEPPGRWRIWHRTWPRRYPWSYCLGCEAEYAALSLWWCCKDIHTSSWDSTLSSCLLQSTLHCYQSAHMGRRMTWGRFYNLRNIRTDRHSTPYLCLPWRTRGFSVYILGFPGFVCWVWWWAE